MKLPKDKEVLFREVMIRAVDESFQLPEDLEVGKVYRSSYFKFGNRGGRDMRFLIEQVEDGYHLDFFLIADDYSMHKRINAAGELIPLENFEGQYGSTVAEDPDEVLREHQRIKEHNEKVLTILKKKGLEA